MPNEARRHHYIPQCYLRGFAMGSGKQCRLQVASLDRHEFFETHPKNVAHVRDFNRIEVEGFKPDVLEGALSVLEGEVAEAIRNISESHKFEGNDKNCILNLISLLAVRSPQMREHWRKFEEQVMKQIMGLALATKERWEGQLRQMKKDGVKVNENITYEQLKEFFDRGEYNIVLNNEHHIGLEFTGQDAVLQALGRRRWKLYISNDEIGCFITGDRPVVITWNKPNEIPVMMRRSPGFGMRETEVYFPLTKHLALLGTFEGEDIVEDAKIYTVALANLRIIEHAFNQVYAPKRSFPYIAPDIKFYHDRLFMERFKAFHDAQQKEHPEGAQSA